MEQRIDDPGFRLLTKDWVTLRLMSLPPSRSQSKPVAVYVSHDREIGQLVEGESH